MIVKAFLIAAAIVFIIEFVKSKSLIAAGLALIAIAFALAGVK